MPQVLAYTINHLMDLIRATDIAHKALLVLIPAGMLMDDLLTSCTNALTEDNDILILDV